MIATLPSSNPMVLLRFVFRVPRPLRCSAEPGPIHEVSRGPGSAAHRWRAALLPGHERSYPSTVRPLLITVTLRDFTLASNETTLPSFHNSIVTVSPG